MTGIDPKTSEIVLLFNPRIQQWNEHFRWNGMRIDGLTDIGRTTIRVLELNSAARIRARLATRLAHELSVMAIRLLEQQLRPIIICELTTVAI